MSTLTEHFKIYEVKCRCCGGMPAKNRKFDHTDLAQRLEDLRELLDNKPIHVISWYRCPAHNAAVGGAERSRHLIGCAADIVVPGRHPYALFKMAHQSSQFDGIGIYPSKGIVHVDIRDDYTTNIYWVWSPDKGYQVGTYLAVAKEARRLYKL